MSVKNIVQRGLFYWKDAMFKKQCRRNDEWMLLTHNLPKLSKEELDVVKQTWPCFDINDKDLTYLKMYKQVYGFNPYFLTDYYFQFILNKTNNLQAVSAFKNKAMYDVYFEKMPVPQTYSKSFAGVGVFDSKMNELLRADEIDMLLKVGTFVIKPTMDTGRGKGVQKIDLSEMENPRDYLMEVFSLYRGNYVTQESIRQHPAISAFNPTSVNTCRITTIYLNNKISSSGVIRVGKNKSKVDNWFTSYIIGINSDGTLRDFGFDAKLQKVYKTDNGVVFGGMKIPHYEQMVQLVRSLHTYYFPTIGVLGWDVCLDEHDNIRIIEVNVDYPGIVGEQLCSGPFFQDRCEELTHLLQ